MPYVNISLDDVEDEDLIDEIEERGYRVHSRTEDIDDLEIIGKIFHLRREGRPHDDILDKYLRDKMGRVI